MSQLKNGYKVMYETEFEHHLKATKSFPASSDVNVTYKKQDGTEIDPKTFKVIFQDVDRFYGSTTGLVSDKVEFSVYSGNDLLLGKEVEA